MKKRSNNAAPSGSSPLAGSPAPVRPGPELLKTEFIIRDGDIFCSIWFCAAMGKAVCKRTGMGATPQIAMGRALAEISRVLLRFDEENVEVAREAGEKQP